MTGFINIYKEPGYTSHDVVAIIRKLTRAKTGHTGTLDPQAEGVLPICLGRATKLADYVMGQDKSYTAEVVLGVTTDTGDMTGQVLSRKPVNFDESKFDTLSKSFTGQQMQVPPMFSAVKVGGKKLYELARQGQTIERKAREVVIHGIIARDFRPETNSFTIDVTCSKGTYIRSLCMDIGEALGTGAAMGALLRTRSGAFLLEGAHRIGEIREAAEAGRLHELVLPVEEMLPYPRAYVRPEGVSMAKNGNPLPVGLVTRHCERSEAIQQLGKTSGLLRRVAPRNDGELVWLHGPDGLIGLFSASPDKLRLEVMM